MLSNYNPGEITLSEAVRRGGKKRKQGFGSLLNFVTKENPNEYQDLWQGFYYRQKYFDPEVWQSIRKDKFNNWSEVPDSEICSCALGGAFEEVFPSFISDYKSHYETTSFIDSFDFFFPGIVCYKQDLENDVRNHMRYSIAKLNEEIVVEGIIIKTKNKTLYSLIAAMNDIYLLTTDQIADWLESQGW